MKYYPFPELTQRERKILDQIAISKDEGHPRFIMVKFVKMDLIEEIMPGRYQLCIAAHIKWCKYHAKMELSGAASS